MKLPVDHRAWPGAVILFVTGFAFAAMLQSDLVFHFFLALMAAHILFFRDPYRRMPVGDAPLSPADGKVVEVSTGMESRYLKEEAVCIGVFLSILVPHVNRSPVEGTVEYLDYVPGKFYNAGKAKSSDHNESNWIGIRDKKGRPILVRQIAGKIARRIYCDVQKDSQVKRGGKLGVICYSSRIEFYVPKRFFKATVSEGENLKTAQSLLGEWLA